jgi:hypothetical protein
MNKLPEPFKKSGQQIGPDGNNRMFFDAYTEDQMLQFRRDALEEALNICSELAEIRGRSIWDCSLAISKLMETT